MEEEKDLDRKDGIINWIVQGLFISYPDEETWHNVGIHSSYKDALLNAKNENKHGVLVRGYFDYRIIKQTCSEQIWTGKTK